MDDVYQKKKTLIKITLKIIMFTLIFLLKFASDLAWSVVCNEGAYS